MINNSDNSELLKYKNRCEQLEKELDHYRSEFENLAEQKTSELQLSEERLELVIDGAELGMWDWDIQADKVRYNKNGLLFLGYKREDIPPNSKGWKNLIHPEDVYRAVSLMESNLKGEIPFIECEYRLRTKSGDWKWTSARGKVVERDAKGLPLRQVGMFMDIDKRKRAEEELTIYRDNLEDLVAKRTAKLESTNQSLQKTIKEHRNIENALRQSEEKFRSLAENILEAIWQIDINGKIVYTSPAIQNVFGYTSEEALGLNYKEFFPRSVHEKLENAFNEVSAGQKYRSLELNGKRKDGTIFPLEISATPVLQDGKIISIQGIARDNSERKRVERKIAESEQRISALLNNLPGMIYRCNNDKNWTMSYISEGAYPLTGYHPSALLDHNNISFADLIHPEDREQIWNSVQEAVNNKSAFEFEYRITTAEGELKYVWERGRAISDDNGFVRELEGFITDITVIKLSEKLLRESENKFRLSFEASAVGMALIDKQGRFLSLNNAACEMLNYSQEELIGEIFTKISHTEDIQESVDRLRQCIENRKPYTIEKRFLTKDRRTVWGQTTVSPIYDDSGELIYAVAHLQDITEQKNAEEKLHEIQGNLKALIENTDDIVISRDLQGRAIEFNSAFANTAKKLFGIEAKPGIRTMDYLPKDAQKHWRAIFAKVHSGQKYREEFEWDFGDEKHYYELSLNPIWASGKVIGSTEFNHDITERKLAEQRLMESEEKYSLAMQATSDGLYDWNLLTNEVYYSPNWKQMLGYKEHELANHLSTWESLTDSEDVKKTFAILDKLFAAQSKEVEFEFKMRHKDGHWVDILSRGNAYYDSNGKPIRFIGTHVNITERKVAEKALKKSEELHREAQKVAHIGHWEYDPETGISIWSDEVFQMFGMDPKHDIPIFTAQDSKILPEDWPEIENGMKRAITEGVPFDLNFRINHPSGKIKWIQTRGQLSVDDNKKPIVFGTAQDITELKHAEEALKESESNLRTLIETIPDMIWVKDPEGRYLSCNPRFERFFGAKETDIKGKTDYDFVPKELADLFREKDKVAMAAGRPSMNEEEVVFADDGHKEILETIKTPLYNPDNELIGVLGIARDITERKTTSQKLQESEAKYRSLFENMMNGFGLHEIVIDDNGKPIDYIFHEVNQAFEKMTGLKRDEIIGKTVTQVLPGTENDPGNWIGRYGQVALSGKSMRFEQFSQVLNKWYSILAFSPMKNFFATMVEDITDRKRASAQLQESEEKYRSLVNNIDLGIALISPEMKISSLNRQMREWFPQADDSGEHICYKTFNVPSRSDICSYCPTIHVFKDGKVHESITETPTPDGIRNYRIVASPVKDSAGNIIAAIESVEDYTERTKAETMLIESERKFRSYVDNAPGGIFVTDENGFYVDANNAATLITGYSRKELLTMHISDLAPDNLKEYAIKGHKTLIASGKLSIEVPFKRKDGSLGYWTVDCSSLGPNRFLGFVNDITETKQLRDLQSRAARLETAGKIAGQVAHDFNNLLGPIMAYPDFIRDELPKDHMALPYLTDIENAARKIADINQDLLTMGRRGHYNQEILNLNSLVQQTVHEIRSQSNKVTYDLQLSDELMNIRGGSAQLHRMLVNLLNNAYDAMGNSGEISIKTTNYYIDDEYIAYTRVPRGEYVRLTVSDNGCGIPEDIAFKIFDPFFTTKTPDKSRGSGLGMSVVDAVIKDHSGYLDLKSEMGQGTSFYIYFPVCREEIDSEDFMGIIGGTESILVVDDDSTQLNVSRKILEKLGYQVTTINNGEKAIEYIQKHPHDLLILDMIMPSGIDGTETYRRILKINPDQRAIIVSGYSETNRVSEAKKLGVGIFVRKPLTKHSIAKAVRQILDRVAQPSI